MAEADQSITSGGATGGAELFLTPSANDDAEENLTMERSLGDEEGAAAANAEVRLKRLT